MTKVIVTGGLGFIGSAFLRSLDLDAHEVVCVDAKTYAADERRLGEDAARIRTETLDVRDAEIQVLVRSEQPRWIVHFAAESHVTRSEEAEEEFFEVNVGGTRNVLEAAAAADVELVVHVSTDEVYGPTTGALFREDQKEPGEGKATSPYARSKAVADDLALSYRDRLPVLIVRPANCFGPWQHPEKAVARWTTRALLGEDLPVWGDGDYVRDWMFVDDVCSAIKLLIRHGEVGQAYNVAPEGAQRPNWEVARSIARAADRDPSCVYLTSYDRPQHDRRYAIDSSKLRSLGWKPREDFDQAMVETVSWYAANEWWWKPLIPGAESLYRDEIPRAGVPLERGT